MFLILITDIAIERGRKHFVYFQIITCLLKQAPANLVVFLRAHVLLYRLALGVLRNKSFGSNIYQRIFRTFHNILIIYSRDK